MMHIAHHGKWQWHDTMMDLVSPQTLLYSTNNSITVVVCSLIVLAIVSGSPNGTNIEARRQS